MTNLTAAEVTNWYLYGQATTPTNLADESLIRPPSPNVSPIPPVDQDLISYMTTGAGRFAIGSMFPLVRAFLERDINGEYAFSNLPYNTDPNAPPTTYTQRQFGDITGINTPEFNFTISFRERDFDDASGDYAERTYIWNSVAFQIDNIARFTIAPDGTRYINNFRIIPFLNENKVENFDFESDDWKASVGGAQLQLDLDPSNIGRRVDFLFTNQVPTTIYTEDNLRDDIQKAASWTHPSDVVLKAAIRQLEDNLFNSGVAPALIDNKPVLYSTTAGMGLSPLLIQSQGSFGSHYLENYVQNGVVEIGGPAIDTLIGGPNDDVLIGNESNDIFASGAGNNYLDGGLNIDTAIYDVPGRILTLSSGGNAPTYPGFAPKDNAPFFTLDHVDGTDVLHSIEKITLSDGADTFKIAANTDLTGLQEVDAGGGIDILDFGASGKAYDPTTNFKNFETLILAGVAQNIAPPSLFQKIIGTIGDYIFNMIGWFGKLIGGTGQVTTNYDTADALTVTISNDNGVDDDGNPIIKLVDNVAQQTTELSDVETIHLGTGKNTVIVVSLPEDGFSDPTIDLGATEPTSDDTVNFSQYEDAVYLSSSDSRLELFSDDAFTETTNLLFAHFNNLVLPDNNNKLAIHTSDAPELNNIKTGDGDNTIVLTLDGALRAPLTIEGGSGTDQLDLSQTNDSYSVSVDTEDKDQVVRITDNSNGDVVKAISVDVIDLSSADGNTVVVKAVASKSHAGSTTINLGATGLENNDTLDFSQYGSGVNLSSGSGDEGSVALFKDPNYKQPAGLQFQQFNTLILSPGDDKTFLLSSDNQYLTQLNTGTGHDAVWSDIVNLQINAAQNAGDSIRVEHAGQGTVINIDKGHAEIFVSDDILLVGAKPTDIIASATGTILHGAMGRVGDESEWITGPDGTKYSINFEGFLAIQDKSGAIMYVADYKGGPDVPLSEQTAGIFVGKSQVIVEKLLDLDRPFNDTIEETVKDGEFILFTKSGKKLLDADPLVLDLNGDGVHLVHESVASPVFDMNNTGFGIHTGWVQPDDALLVHDKNHNGQIDAAREMFGGPGAQGFDALANYDLNTDGVIDANDAVYGELQVWRDLNGNARVDAGELQTLTQAGIASISLATTPQTDLAIAGNTVTALGSFIRMDGSTGTVANVNFVTSPFHSIYLGDTSVSAAAAAMPNLKGFGTLADLHVAMTLDPTLIDVVNATLPNLTAIDLPALRDAAMPIFTAWAHAVPLPDADGNPQTVAPNGHADIAIFVHNGVGPPTVDDFAYLFTDENQPTFWKLASGDDVLDENGAVIEHPTFAQVLAQQSPDGEWQTFSGSQIEFMERYIGQSFPIDAAPEDPDAMLDAMSAFINASWMALNFEALRLAMQGPLSSYFDGVAYDATDNTFHATTDRQLTPMYEAIFNAAPADAAGAAAWP